MLMSGTFFVETKQHRLQTRDDNAEFVSTTEIGGPWVALDDSIWERIFRYIPFRSLVRMEAVCRRWCKAIRSKRLWSNLNLKLDTELNVKFSPSQLAWLVSHSALGAPRKPLVNGLNFWARFSPIREIDLTGILLSIGSPIKYLQPLGHCKKLETLKMSNLKPASDKRRSVFFLSKDFVHINEFLNRSEKLKRFEFDARVHSAWSFGHGSEWLDPWQWRTMLQWIKSPTSVVQIVHLEIMNLPISTFARLPDNQQTHLEDYVHPFVNLKSLGEALTLSNVKSVLFGRRCSLGDAGTLLLLESIRENRSIQRLQIRHSLVTSSGARKIANSLLQGCPPLNHVDLRYNMISREAALYLQQFGTTATKNKEFKLTV